MSSDLLSFQKRQREREFTAPPSYLKQLVLVLHNHSDFIHFIKASVTSLINKLIFKQWLKENLQILRELEVK